MGSLVEATPAAASKIGSFNMRERKDPKFVQFADGEVVEGVFIGVDTVEVGAEKKKTAKISVRDLDSGEIVQFLATYDISTKLKRSDIGHVISVRYEGEDSSVRRGNNNLKRFKVLVSDKPYSPAKGNKLEDGTYITDEDIPF